MEFEMPTDGFDPDKVGGQQKLFPGGFLMEVTSIGEGERGDAVITAEIISGTVPGLAGATWKCYLAMEYKEWPLRKIYAFAIATGILTQKEYDEHKRAGTSPKIDFEKSVGRPFCVELGYGQGDYADRFGLMFDNFWHPADKRANHIPLNVKKLASYNPPITLPAGRDPNGIATKAGPTRGPAAKPNPQNQAANVDEMTF